MANKGMLSTEKRATSSLGMIYAFRMIGLFMIFPIFSIYADQLDGSTPLLVGVALGAYGLTQALFQIPFGLLSDRFGRKPIIAFGLILFALGSIVAGMAESITTMIIGRALQGSGAIAAAIMAMAADLTREEQRTKIMASIGASIGMSFIFSLIAGPFLVQWLSLSGLFWLTALLAMLALGILFFIVPTPALSRTHPDAQAVPSQLLGLLKSSELLRLDFGILVLHMVITASFVVIPLLLRGQGIDITDHWTFYLPALLGALAIMVPAIIIAETKGLMKPVFLAAIALVLISQLLFALSGDSVWVLGIALFVFFSGFNVLEATLPSLISKIAPADKKGSAMGIYASSQFLGAFLGGVLGGWLYGLSGASTVFVTTSAVLLCWLWVASRMQKPSRLASHLISLQDCQFNREELMGRLLAVPGVVEAVIVIEDNVAYLRVDKRALDEDALKLAYGSSES